MVETDARKIIKPTVWRSLIARLVGLNMLGLLVLVGGFLTFQESRQLLTNAYRQSLETQANLIAGALAPTAQAQNPFQFFEPSIMNRLLQNGGRSDWQLRDAEAILARARLVSVARLRLYARNGRLVLDSAHMDRSARVIAKSLPPMPGDDTMPGLMQNLMKAVTSIWRDPTPLLSEINAADGLRLTEVTRALRGQPASAQRQSEEGGDILTVAVPVQGYRAVVGALMVSTQPGEIDALLAEERQLIFQLSAIALVVNIITSLLLAATMVVPVRRLAAAMRGFGSTSPSLPGLETIPDLSHRRDEIAELSGALRDMTERLLSRINTIDRFAADVAHELKNPLTSLHSAVQSLDQSKSGDREQLMGIIHNDINRLNRLISDISKATRLDAELSLEPSEPFDLSALAGELSAALTPGFESDNQINLVVRADTPCPVLGQKPRIAQIIDNLLTNAASFTPAGGRVFLTTQQRDGEALLLIADEGPGLAADTQEKIFERFYTDRTQQPARQQDTNGAKNDNAAATGKLGHSGLGLSISRQIARAHGGDLIADNRPDGTGAYFTLSLPLAAPAPPRRKRSKDAPDE
ncbi:sensor histidine kinase [Alphaproteobacteria bacterium]|nr:sensor histidine kinase [Alphaproteobacteria bacterium]MDB2641975.1 sensor histidine kinase [Alphaproteobacteria bacterium]